MQRLTLIIITLLSCSLTSFLSVAQSEKSKFEVTKYSEDKTDIKIVWGDVVRMTGLLNEEIEYLYFDGALYDAPQSFLPEYSSRVKLKSNSVDANVSLENAQFEAVSIEEAEILRKLDFKSNSIEIKSEVGYYRMQPFLQLSFVPIRYNSSSGRYEKLVSFSFDINEEESNSPSHSRFSNLSFELNSVLRSGTWGKVGVIEDGIYKVDYSYLTSNNIISGAVPSSSIRLFGNGGGMLPFQNSEERIDDLAENAIYLVDGGDGSFDNGDYFLFYGQSQHRWDRAGSGYSHDYNFMADTTYYFISGDYQVGSPKRITNKANSSASPTITVSSFDDYVFNENNWTNFVKSGRNWYGEYFNIQRIHEFSFNFANIQTQEATIKAVAAGRAIGRSSSMDITVNGNKVSTLNFSSVSNNYTSNYVNLQTSTATFFPTSNNISVKLEYISPSASDEAWLDYLELEVKRSLTMDGNIIMYRNKDTESEAFARYQLGNATNDIQVWDVTDPTTALNQQYSLSGNTLNYVTEGNELKEFVAFKGNSFPTPQSHGLVTNQNLHSLPQTDYIIITHPLFEDEANRLAEFHRGRGDLTVNVVTTTQVYNEFSSGAQDITAIKSLMKMFYDRSNGNLDMMPKYLLLFGDASYDYKYVLDNNTNYVPAYQSVNSYTPTLSYISDDYFGFLDDSEGDAINSILDIGVGRFPVKTIAEARNAVDKVISYHNKPDVLGRWRNWVAFVGDDEDGNIHMRQANELSKKIENNHGNYNIRKIFFDAYPQESHFGGEAYPGVNEAINDVMNRGAVLLTYVGHGGELGWAHERVLNISDINGWENNTTMPLFLTATCEFSRFDDPARTSAGEFVFLNPKGGGIGMLTTTRLVYSSPNYELSQSFMDNVFDEVNGQVPTFGDLLRVVKDRTDLTGSKGVNYRNFALLGDPAIRLPVPQYDITLTDVPDTIKALEKVTIKGFISNSDGSINTDFNGEVYPTVFDRKKSVTTLDNDGIGEFGFEAQTDVIFRGRAKATNGEFEFSFVVPKDISFEYGQSRISVYAENNSTDAQGYYDNFEIGGKAENVAEDNTGPTIDLYLNDSTFIKGGMTNDEPILIAKVFDENGINTVGNGIGHDIVAVLDENSANAIVLNDYYESDLDSYKSGVIQYPFSSLDEGKHTLSLKVWDVYNNSGTAETEFVVANDAGIAIDHVLNYPNPFTTNTGFYFEHNAPGQPLEVTIQIFSVSGKLVKVIHNELVSDGYRIGPIEWDGRDEFGDKIGRGVYVYKVKVSSNSSGSTEEFEKLVILN